VVKMLVIVVAMFGICWLPLHAFILVLDFFPSVGETVSGSTLTSLFISCHWLAMSNSFANPIIYGFTNESFRADLVTLFYMWFPCCVCLTKMMPRYSSGSTYETVVFRRQSLYKQGAKFNGTYQTRTVRAQRTNEYFPNRSRTRFEYVDFPCANGKAVVNGKVDRVKNGCGQRVIMSLEKDYVRLKPVDKNSISANSEPSVEES
ncbi:TLR2-like protein, partial [Mya arenaria]